MNTQSSTATKGKCPRCGGGARLHYANCPDAGAEVYALSATLIDGKLAEPNAAETPRRCTCHPGDNPPVPCPGRHALHECREVALREEVEDILSVIDAPNVGAIVLQGGDLNRLRNALRATLAVLLR